MLQENSTNEIVSVNSTNENEITTEVTSSTPPVQQTEHKAQVSEGKKDETKLSLADKILHFVLGDSPKEALSNAKIREKLAMRSSKYKGLGKGASEAKRQEELAKEYKALHPTMQKLYRDGKVLFFKEGNSFKYYRAPAKPETK